MHTCHIAGIVREDDGSGYTVYFPDVPVVCASGTTPENGFLRGGEGLRLTLRDMVEQGKVVPVSCSMEEARDRVRTERALDALPFSEGTLFQYVPAPDLENVPVMGNISPKRSPQGD